MNDQSSGGGIVEGLTDSQMIANLAGRVATLEQRFDLHEGMITGNWPTSRVRFDSPVGTAAERASAKLWPGAWWDASPYGKVYTSSTGAKAIHTGADLNAPEDVNAPVYAPADGVVRFAGVVSGWQLQMVVIEHLLEDGSRVWSRNAHLIGLVVSAGDMVLRGARLGYIGDYSPVGPKGNHDHYDLARKNLGETPGDWPGMDEARVIRDYLDPLAFTRDRHGQG